MSDPDVIIVGAGSTGLLLAQGLRSAGISFRIFERSSATAASREWSMSLHWGAEFLEKALPHDLYTRQREIDTDPRYDNSNEIGFIQCNGQTAETILVMAGFLPRRVSRRKLKALLAEGLDIEFDKKLDTIKLDATNDQVAAHFSDGSTVNAKIIIGCDGSRSRVRDIMIGDMELSRNVDLPYTLFNFPCSYPRDISTSVRDIHPVMKVAYHPTQNMMYLLAMADAGPADAAEWKHQNLISWSGPPYASDLQTREAKVERLKSIAPHWAHPWSTAINNVSDDTEIFVDTTSQWDPRPVFQSKDGKTSWNGNEWHGHVTLAGDSAHTMLPHRGQGLNNALEDAARLLTALRAVFKDQSKDLNSTIAEYETEAVSRGGLEVEITSKQARAAHNWQMLMESPMFKHGANKAK